MLEWAAQEGGGITVAGSVQETTGHGTWCYGLVDTVVFYRRLYFMILEFFSNIYDSMINRTGNSIWDM